MQVEPGQEYVTDASGLTYQIMWNVDEMGTLVARVSQALIIAGANQRLPQMAVCLASSSMRDKVSALGQYSIRYLGNTRKAALIQLCPASILVLPAFPIAGGQASGSMHGPHDCCHVLPRREQQGPSALARQCIAGN